MKTNREYFSWSQYQLWKSSKRTFYKKYILGEDNNYNNKYFDKGNKFGKANETLEFDEMDEIESLLFKSIPRYETSEFELNTNLNDDKNYKLLAYVDSIDLDTFDFIEYKTGKIKWDEKRVEKHKQMLFYAVCIWENFKVVPNAKLVWIETKENEDGELEYTGKYKEFNVKITIDEILEFKQEIINTIDEIENYNFEQIIIDNNIDKKIVKLINRIKKDTAELNNLKAIVITNLLSEDANSGIGENATYSISKRKTYTYPEYIEQTKKEFDKELKRLKKQALNNNEVFEDEKIMLRVNVINKQEN